MKKLKHFILLVLLPFLFLNEGQAQINIKDSSATIPLFQVGYAFHVPGGDLADRFGVNSSINGTFLLKTKKNWLFGADYSYIFGSIIKEDSLFRYIVTESGDIIDGNGMFAQVYTYERGFNASLRAGKLFPVFGPNPNSGLYVMLGGGLLQHKIRIENPENVTPQIKGDYKKGYDRLTNGFSLNQFVGYMHLGNNRLVSFYAGLECTQAWTMNRRDYNIDLMGPDTQKRLDLLYGVRVGWIIPIYGRTPEKYYYN